MPRLIDLHCDTIYRMYGDSNSNMTSNDYNVDIEKLVKANSFVQCFALFNHVKTRKNMYKNMLDFLDFYLSTISVHDNLSLVNKFSQVISFFFKDSMFSFVINSLLSLTRRRGRINLPASLHTHISISW